MFKRKYVLLTTIILILLAIAGRVYFFRITPETMIKQDITAPSFTLLQEDQTSLSIDNMNEACRMVHFWASWCAPCLEELPALNQFLNELPQEISLRMLAISVDESWQEAQKLIKKGQKNERIIYLLDTSAKVAESYGSFQYPETYLLNNKNKIIMKWVGPQDWQHPYFRNLLHSHCQKNNK